MGTNNQNNPSEIDAHGKYTQAYVDILNTYKTQINDSVKNKNELKTKFFWLISIIMTVINIYAVDHAIYSTPNKGYLFAANLFSGQDYELIDAENGRAEKVILPVRKNEVMAYVNMSTTNYDCMVEPVGDAPAMGIPGDFTVAQRYLVKNVANRPAGVPQAMAMYEITITSMPAASCCGKLMAATLWTS